MIRFHPCQGGVAWLVLVVVGLLVWGCDRTENTQPKQAGGRSDKEAIVGRWIPTAVHQNAELLDGSHVETQRTLTFSGGSFEWGFSGSYALSPDTRPKQIDMFIEFRDSRETLHAIYDLNGDEFRLAFSSSRDPRSSASTAPSTRPSSAQAHPEVAKRPADTTPGPGRKVLVFHRAG
jgi:uncharacterized protein (TIGR03067 family)